MTIHHTGTQSGDFRAGVWEAGPGRLRGSRKDWMEVIQVLEGKATVRTDSGPTHELEAGDVLVFPEGWVGTWEIHENFRHFYVLQHFPTAGAETPAGL